MKLRLNLLQNSRLPSTYTKCRSEIKNDQFFLVMFYQYKSQYGKLKSQEITRGGSSTAK